MRNIITIGILLCIMIICAGPANAQQKGPAEAVAQGLVETVATGCDKELAAYCQGVTPGDGRILACLYAHADKLSGQCEYALFDASAQLERAVGALTYLASECGDDLEKHCADVHAGEGRLLDCLNKNKKKTSSRCRQALKDTGLK
ncbi:conserved uncharacterized protein with cystein rich domain [Desulfosarcina variabilis str. Montpellier]|uniref:cysteine rich repeat-containing protein n=1 Tax=Desulfosarcina variabilis TaxID=2300 RepID=UPI003AFB7DCD